jgi:protein-S-isoprenylcysteine O-methyltransferase Ste14
VKTFEYSIRILARWAGITASLSVLLFLSAGTTHVPSLRVYLAAFSAWLLLTMFAVDPGLAKERAHPGAGAVGGATQFVSGLLLLLTLIVAAVDGRRMHCLGGVPAGLRFVALAVFGLSGALQTWAMAVNPFFSTVVRLQKERGHYVIRHGPYRFVRHPGYLAMVISMPASAIAIGSWIALLPAAGFIAVAIRRKRSEDEFLRMNLSGYRVYASEIRGGLFPCLRVGHSDKGL